MGLPCGARGSPSVRGRTEGPQAGQGALVSPADRGCNGQAPGQDA